jgi:hypothetical protein
MLLDENKDLKARLDLIGPDAEAKIKDLQEANKKLVVEINKLNLKIRALQSDLGRARQTIASLNTLGQNRPTTRAVTPTRRRTATPSWQATGVGTATPQPPMGPVTGTTDGSGSRNVTAGSPP